ncbi:hypothetical protein PRZ48_009311 [Zasmidium cellare]|uniref:DUF4190 domain-containing protein n=1 Tax=Zasmidium cellare TaxID=395010 RepID=A0ABR0EC14_ZASCE|nr:hypothetical protein PRZ48_009311 [Zasmidium cellare]
MDGGRNDTLGAVPLASHFRGDVVFPGLLIGGLALEALCWAGLATFPGWHEEHDARTGSDIDIKPFPSRPVTNACIMASGLATIFFLISALWQHIAAAATISVAKSVTHDQLNGRVGAAATVLVWLTFGLSVLPFLGLFIMSLSIRLLDKLIED